MRSAYIVSYDISDQKRWRKVYKAMYGFGDHIQFSVFRCELSQADKIRMLAKIDPLIHHDEDQILIIDIGPAPGRADNCIEALGKSYIPRERTPVIV
jgi:CRISPR-associated protein Cas2